MVISNDHEMVNRVSGGQLNTSSVTDRAMLQSPANGDLGSVNENVISIFHAKIKPCILQ